MAEMQIDVICRACLREDDKMIDMFEKDVYYKFLIFANLTAESEIPGISLNLCESCEQKLNIAFDFKEECQKSHEILLNYVRNICEVKFEATKADTFEFVPSEATDVKNTCEIKLEETYTDVFEETTDVDNSKTCEVELEAKKPLNLQLKLFSQYQVLEAIKYLKGSYHQQKNCIRCSFVGSHASALSKHVSRRHKDLEPRWCCVCNAEFDDLTGHVATNHSDIYTCKFCSNKFLNMPKIIRHLHCHSDVKAFQCSVCGKLFQTASKLKNHKRKHTREALHECTHCNEKFKTFNHLVSHKRTHTDITTSSDDSCAGTPPEVRQMAQNALGQLLPEKSRTRYEAQYNVFTKWCEEKGATIYTENVVLAYFTDLVGKNKKSLWAIFSMLKSCIMLNRNIDISKYAKLITYIKTKTEHYKPKKSVILDEENIGAFVAQAPNDNFLLMKVVLIIGVSGGLRREELTNMVVKDIEEKDDIIVITIPNTKTNTSRSFVITKEEWVVIVRLYLKIRLKITKRADRLFLKYENGKCCAVPVGINNIGSIPSKIATFLKLPNPRQYSGHCFRRSSATLLANRGGDLSLKKHGTVVESYVASSLKRKIDVMTEAGPSGSKKLHSASSAISAEDSSIEVATNTKTELKSIG